MATATAKHNRTQDAAKRRRARAIRAAAAVKANYLRSVRAR